MKLFKKIQEIQQNLRRKTFTDVMTQLNAVIRVVEGKFFVSKGHVISFTGREGKGREAMLPTFYYL